MSYQTHQRTLPAMLPAIAPIAAVGLLAWAIIIFVLPQDALAQRTGGGASSSVSAEKKRLERLQQSIETTRKKLQQTTVKEQRTLRTLELRRREAEEVRGLVFMLSNTITGIKDSIHLTEKTLDSLSAKLDELRTSYATLLKSVHRESSVKAAEANVFAALSETETQALKNITTLASLKADEITSLQEEILRRKSHLDSLRQEKEMLARKKTSEEQQLKQAVSAHQKSLDQLKKNKSALSKQLEEKQKSAQEITRLVAIMIEKERKERERREAAARKAKQSPKNAVASVSGGVAPPLAAPENYEKAAFRNRSLPWPVAGRKVIHPFGQTVNKKTGSTTENLGIGIASPPNSPVRAVAEGWVSLVHWLPGYGSLVILDHRNGFRTVYANLSTVECVQGQKLAAGSVVGKSGSSLDGDYVHFEIWKGKNKLNPNLWLR